MIYKANSEILENMDKNVDVHNISEERNVGSFNYASIVRDGGKFLKSTSQDVVVKPSTDLFEIISPGEFRKFWNRSAYSQEIKTKSNEKMCLLQEKGCKERDLLKKIFLFILRNEQKHLNELRFLKEQEIEGPVFVWGVCKKVCCSCEETKKKRHRMYIEVK